MTKILIEIDTDTQRVVPLVDMIEVVARSIYMQWRDVPGYVTWVTGGNSLMQDSARRIAATALDVALAAAPQPEPVDADLRRDAELWRAHQKRKQDLIDRGFLRNPLRAAPQDCLAETVTIDAAMLSQGELSINEQANENAALRAEVELLRKDKSNLYQSYEQQRQQLAASQLEAKRLREALESVSTLIDNSTGVIGLHLNGDVAPWEELRAGGRFESWLLEFDEALSSPTSTDALDAYVAEKVNDAHEDGHNEGLSYSAPIIAEITRQRDLAVSAIENLVKQKGRHNTEIAYKKLVDVLAAIKESEV